MQEQKDRDAYEVLNVRRDAHEVVVKAAFRALAALYHPDRDPSPGAARRMMELNRAYGELRSSDQRAVYDRGGSTPPAEPVAPVAQPTSRFRTPPQGRASPGSAVLDFGRYQGWTVADLARNDPDYLRWLSRHSSGIRYRREIADRLLAAAAPASEPQPRKRGR